jgi:hypothetical protein
VWVHGNVAPEINRDWLGIVGPGIKNGGIEDDVWSDQTDVRPTMLAVLGLADDYQHQGRVISELLKDGAKPASARRHQQLLEQLGVVYKKLNAPLGAFGLATLRLATEAARGGSPSDDHVYAETVHALQRLERRRDQLSDEIAQTLDGAWFQGRTASADEIEELIARARDLLNLVTDARANP